MDAVIIYGFIAIIIMLIFIYQRLGSVVNNSNNISNRMDAIDASLEKIETELDDIENNTSIVAKIQKDENEQII